MTPIPSQPSARDLDLEQRLREAAKHKMTPAEIREQRVSFVYGMLSHNSPLTKDQVREILAKTYG